MKKYSQFFWGVLVGFMLTAWGMMQAFDLDAEKIQAASQQQIEVAAMLTQCTAQMTAALDERQKFHTVLFEPAGDAGTIASGFIAQQIGVPPPSPRQVPRWLLPGKARPALIGTSRGEAYFHVENATGKMDGPHPPEGGRP